MFHYTACGLTNVWLQNGFTKRLTKYGEAVSIEDTDGLHRVLALDLAQKPGRMTGKELRFLRTLLGLSQEGLAKLLGVTEQSVSLWERTGKVPQQSDVLLRLLILENFNGNARVGKVIERVNTVERLAKQKLIATESHKRWRVSAADEEDVAVA